MRCQDREETAIRPDVDEDIPRSDLTNKELRHPGFPASLISNMRRQAQIFAVEINLSPEICLRQESFVAHVLTKPRFYLFRLQRRLPLTNEIAGPPERKANGTFHEFTCV